MKKLTGIVFHDEFRTMDQASPRITLWQDGSIDKKAKPALLLIAEDGEQLPEVMTKEEVRDMLLLCIKAQRPEGPTIHEIAINNGITL